MPLIVNQPIGIGAVSYADGFSIGIVADAAACPDIGVLADAVREQLAWLERSADERPSVTAGGAVAPTVRG